MPIVLPSLSRPELTEPTYVKPPVWKPVLAWVGVVLGVLFLAAAVGTLGDGVRGSAGIILLGLAMVIPGAWWIYCERKDRAHAEEDYRLDQQAARAQQSMAGFVAPGALTPLTWDTPLTPVKRRWSIVATISVALFIVAVVVLPPVEAEPEASPSPVTNQVETTVTTTTPSSPPSSTAASEPSVVTVTEVADADEADVPGRPYQPFADQPSDHQYAPVAAVPGYESASAAAPAPVAPAPSYVPAPAPAPAPAPVAAAPPASAYYPNCSAARAAGVAPIQRGQPGYAPKLDRDNDGVACE